MNCEVIAIVLRMKTLIEQEKSKNLPEGVSVVLFEMIFYCMVPPLAFVLLENKIRVIKLIRKICSP